MIPLNELVTANISTIKNITNEVETTSAVTKNRYEVINSVKNVGHNTIENIGEIKTEPVINSIELSKSTQQLIDDIDLDKNSSTVIKSVDLVNNKVSSTAIEDINGVVEFAGNGLMIVNTNDSDITIYSIPKISSIN